MANVTEKNSWLCIYAIAQIGRPYWYGCHGQISTASLYTSTVLPNLNTLGYDTYSNYKAQLNVKVHDCAGLVGGALMCEGVDVAPTLASPIALGATSQFNGNCSSKSETMSNFPYIPGTLVFHSTGATKTHVGIYVGTFKDKSGVEHTDAVVEAMGHAYGVTVTKVTNSKWNAWGQLSVCTIDTIRGMSFDYNTNPKSASQTFGGGGQASIQTQNMRPFVATVLGEHSVDLNYNKIKDARISAMMFFGGELYDASHTKRSYYANPNLATLTNKCNSAGLPYALYVNVRARTVIEADEECRVLYYVLAEYPPKLGIWLSLNFNVSKSVGDAILEVYYKYIEKWGLKARCGLYVTPEQLSRITWVTFQERFYLWEINSMKVSTIDDELLQPEMFEVPD